MTVILYNVLERRHILKHVCLCLFSMVFIYIANTFTQYKNTGMDPKMYLVMANVAAVQLTEFFLWRNIKNPRRNEFFSKIAAFVVGVQPLILACMIPNENLRYFMILALAASLFLFMILKKDPIQFQTSVAKNGHLSWHWINFKGPWLLLFVTFFYGVSIYAINNFKLSIFMLAILAIALINYFKYGKYQTIGSMWCWSSNIFFLFLIIEILIIKPFQDYSHLC